VNSAIKKAIFGSMIFECKKAENKQEMNKNLHIFGFLIMGDIELKHPDSVSIFLHNKCLNDYVVEFLCSTITPKAIDLNGRLLITFVVFLHKQYGFVVLSIFYFLFLLLSLSPMSLTAPLVLC
jgi:hypothetical protein